MTRILHIANFNSLRLKGCFQCGFPVKITSGLIKNGFEVINYADRDLCRMFGFGHMNALGRWRLNKHLLEFCRTTRPDAILLGHANTVENETILKIRKTLPGIKVMQWNCDAVTPESKRNVNALNERLEVVDLTMISTGDKKCSTCSKKTANRLPIFPTWPTPPLKPAPLSPNGYCLLTFFSAPTPAAASFAEKTRKQKKF